MSALQCPWLREPLSCSCFGNVQCPEPPGGVLGGRDGNGRGAFYCSRAQGSRAGSFWVNGLPKTYNFKSWKEDIFQPLYMYCSHNYFMIRLIAKETGESSFPWCLAPAEAGTRAARDRAYLSRHNPLLPAPFLSHPLSPSVSSSSNTNCLHGKSPSMTRFSTHKRKLWATDPTS